MNPLITLWLFVLGITVALSGFFYLAENYSHILGNFYFLIGAFVGSYVIYIFINWMMHRSRKKEMRPK